MMETARLGWRDRVRGIFFIVALDGLNDAGIDAQFDEFAGNTQGIFDGQSAACAMRDDGYPVDTNQRTSTIHLIVRPVADREEGILRQHSAELANGVGH